MFIFITQHITSKTIKKNVYNCKQTTLKKKFTIVNNILFTFVVHKSTLWNRYTILHQTMNTKRQKLCLVGILQMILFYQY